MAEREERNERSFGRFVVVSVFDLARLRSLPRYVLCSVSLTTFATLAAVFSCQQFANMSHCRTFCHFTTSLHFSTYGLSCYMTFQFVPLTVVSCLSLYCYLYDVTLERARGGLVERLGARVQVRYS